MKIRDHFMRHSPLGYDKDGVITVNIARIQNRRDIFTHQIKSWSGIEDISYGESILSSSDQYMGWGRFYKGERIDYQVIPVHHTFLNVMGIEITEGRNFRKEDENTQYGVYVFNETAKKKYNLEINTAIDYAGEIIGFMPDVKFASFRIAVEPMAFYVWGTQNWGNQSNIAYIKLKQGVSIRASIMHIQETLEEFDPDYSYDVLYYDDVLKRLYEKETSLSSLISLFSVIAIFISIVGVFGLVVFDSECRRKEIGIRKVFGASTAGIIIMFNKAYLRMLLICFVIATPFAWYAVSRWLENFAYQTPLYWWVYLLAFFSVSVITFVTVTFQNWRVANENPVNSVKTE